MSDPIVDPQDADVKALADDIAGNVEDFLGALETVASGAAPDEAVAVLLLVVSQVLLAGAKLGATTDVILPDNAEPDVDEDADVDALRAGLAGQLATIDEYVEVFDPYRDDGPEAFRLSDDLGDVALDLVHGLRHFKAGRPLEALWWWQFSYLSHWGTHAGAVLRALHAVVAHARLDVVEEEVPPEVVTSDVP